jgi:hypothetical protein
MNIKKWWTLLLWVLPSGILGWREAKAETAKRKVKNIEEKRVTAIWSWKKRECEEGFCLVALRKQS